MDFKIMIQRVVKILSNFEKVTMVFIRSSAIIEVLCLLLLCMNLNIIETKTKAR